MNRYKVTITLDLEESRCPVNLVESAVYGKFLVNSRESILDIQCEEIPREIKITKEFLSQYKFRPFTKFDWMGYAGCESPVPLMAETGEFDLIIDGDEVQIWNDGEMLGRALMSEL